VRITLLVVATLSAVLAGCGKGGSPHSERGQSPAVDGPLLKDTQSSQSAKKLPSMSIASLQPFYGNASSKNRISLSAEEEPVWLMEALKDPDPRVRLHAIETWAAKPDKTLDPVTYALVDTDETIRARAQELLEEALERTYQD
jgi:hypothetical protein